MAYWVGAFKVAAHAAGVAADHVVATVNDAVVVVVVASEVTHSRSPVKVLNAETTKVA